MWRYPTLSPNTKLEKHKIFTFQGLDVAPYVALSDTFPKLKVLEKNTKFSISSLDVALMWRYVALCGAIRRYPQTQDFTKNTKLIKIIKFQNLDVALCGTI